MARIAFACLTAITVAAAAPALAQPAPAPAAPAPMTAAPAAPMTAAPMAPAADPAMAAPAAPAPAPLPTTGISARILQVLDQACLPMIRAPGTDPKTIAKAVGLKNTRDGWQLKEDKVNSLMIRLPNSVNPSSCDIVANYDVGQGPALVAGLAAWGANQPQPLVQDKGAETEQGADRNYTTTNWVGWSASTRMGLSFTEEKKLDGGPVGKNADVARVAFSFRALTDMDRR